MNTDDATTRPAPSPAEASSALAHAARLAASTRTRGWRWVRLYLTGWAAASVGLVLTLGLGGQVGFVVGMSAWAVIVTAGVTWAARQGSMAAGTRRRLFLGAGGWAAVYGVTLFVGLDRFAGDVAFWLPAALLSTAPLLLAAWLPAPREAAAATA
ncbi:hypothetical protein [Cellulosimicrobium protaetiae]|uniref:Uncharacterized protein n=1 Tax=Cellulosimicrobium protaetiae TaxID=2587808 RepID=A0A6M5UA39_9MICO|nr:hypothetical protein [Cellulosimicrobium protaetiae]QJW35336.1 hypothetical protein FIC82_003095 [Cellulosimicrobium protaetiae]